jgi:hypothetical protein
LNTLSSWATAEETGATSAPSIEIIETEYRIAPSLNLLQLTNLLAQQNRAANHLVFNALADPGIGTEYRFRSCGSATF